MAEGGGRELGSDIRCLAQFVGLSATLRARLEHRDRLRADGPALEAHEGEPAVERRYSQRKFVLYLDPCCS